MTQTLAKYVFVMGCQHHSTMMDLATCTVLHLLGYGDRILFCFDVQWDLGMSHLLVVLLSAPLFLVRE